MEKLKDQINEHPAYAEFTGLNEKFLYDLTSTLKDIINDLNSRNSVTDELFTKLAETIEICNAVFRSFSSHDGLELVLRLKAIADLYRKNLDCNTNLTVIAGHILKKLDRFNSTFYHEATSDEIIKPALPDTAFDEIHDKGKDLVFKWITFERNGSFFLTQFKSIEITDYSSYLIHHDHEESHFVEFNGRNYPLIDLMKPHVSEFKTPSKLVFIDNSSFYAADHTGREIHGSYDMITPISEPLEVSGSYLSGRVRLFGRRYLVIKPFGSIRS